MVMTMATTMNKKIGMKRRKRRKKKMGKKERDGQEEQTPKAGRDTHVHRYFNVAVRPQKP